MSQASRARRQHLINRLEELDRKLGPREPQPAPAPYLGDPDWGPVGSLARACMDAEEYAALVDRDAEVIARERATHRLAAAAEPRATDADGYASVINLDEV